LGDRKDACEVIENRDEPGGRRVDRRSTDEGPITVPPWLPGSSQVDPDAEPIFAELVRKLTGTA